MRELRRIPAPLVVKLAESSAESWGTAAAAIVAGVSSRTVTSARWSVWYDLHRRGWSLAAIGRFFRRDHTTVLHGVKRTEEALAESDPATVSALEDLALISPGTRGARNWLELPSGERIEIETFDRGSSKTWRPVSATTIRRVYG